MTKQALLDAIKKEFVTKDGFIGTGITKWESLEAFLSSALDTIERETVTKAAHEVDETLQFASALSGKAQHMQNAISLLRQAKEHVEALSLKEDNE